MNQKERFLTTDEVAQLLRYKSGKHVADLCRQRKLPAVQVAGKWLIDRAKLESLLDGQQEPESAISHRPKRYVSTGISDAIKAMR